MKSIIFIMLMLISVSTIAQDVVPANKPTVADQTTQIINTVFDRTTEAIGQLASSLKVPAEHVYAVLIKQQHIYAVTWLVINIVLLLIVFLAYLPSFFDNNYLEDMWGLPLFFAILFLIIFCISISTITSGFGNPEYGAIQDILKLLH